MNVIRDALQATVIENFGLDCVDNTFLDMQLDCCTDGGSNAKRRETLIVDFNIDDVDSEYKRLLQLGVEMLNQPTPHPWGARSFQFKDPDGNILNFRSFPNEK